MVVDGSNQKNQMKPADINYWEASNLVKKDYQMLTHANLNAANAPPPKPPEVSDNLAGYKPVLQWLGTLPEPYRSAAISQHDGDNRDVSRLWTALCYFRSWNETMEGYNFWSEVAYAVERKEPLPPYPITVNDLCSCLEKI